MYILISTLTINLITLYLFWFVWKLEILGIGIATTITSTINLALITVYSFISKNVAVKYSQKWITLEAFKKIPKFLKYGIPSCAMVFIDWLAFEILTIYTGWLGVNELAASVVMTNFLYILQESSLGISYTSSSLIGNPLGEKKPNIAKKFAWATVVWAAIWSGFTALVYLFSHDYVLRLYTSDENVISLANSAFIIFTITIFLDMMQVSKSGIIRAMGFQKFATIWNFIAWWCVMLPISYLWGFTFSLNFKGVWIGLPVGNVLLVIAYLLIILFAPWSKISEAHKIEPDTNECAETDKKAIIDFF